MCNCPQGGELSSYFGRVGSQLGTGIQKRIKSFTGLGDYKITYNSLIEGSRNVPVSFSQTSRGLIVAHREYLGDIITNPSTIGAFNFVKYTVNPGNVVTFPWMAPIALQHDQYRPLGVIFNFVSTASETSTTASLGSVVMATQYDVTDLDPTNKSDMLNRDYSSEVKMSQDMIHGLECSPLELDRQIYYVQALASTVSDPRDFTLANFYVATQGGTLPTSTIVGSLYVIYEFEFFKQVPIQGLPNKAQLYQQSSNTALALSSIFLKNCVVTSGKNLGIFYTTSGVYDQINIPIQYGGCTIRFLLLIIYPVVQVAAAFTPPTLVNCTATTSNIVQWSAPSVGASSTCAAFEMYVNINSNISTPATILFNYTGPFVATAPSGGSTYQQIVAEIVSKTYQALS